MLPSTLAIAAGDHWREIKVIAEVALYTSSDALHVLLSIPALIVAALIIRKPLSHPAPIMLLLAIELLNEANDFRHLGLELRVWGDAVGDIALTMLLPLVIMVAARFRPSLFNR